MSRRFGPAWFLIPLLALVPLTLGPAPAGHAAPPKCYGNGCKGKGPVSQNCDDDAGSIDQVQVSTGYGPAVSQLIYSPACHAMWARGRSLNTGEDQGVPHPADFYVKIVARNSINDNLIYSGLAYIEDNVGVWNWTNMAPWESHTKVHACVHWDESGQTAQPEAPWKCTQWWIVSGG